MNYCSQKTKKVLEKQRLLSSAKMKHREKKTPREIKTLVLKALTVWNILYL